MGDPRRTAWEVLNRWVSAGQYSNLALDTALKRDEWTDADRGLLTVLVYGVIEKSVTLDAWIEQLSNLDGAEISVEVRNLLRLGLYQMAFLDRVPDHAAVNETVSLAPRRVKGFVNAILRTFARHGKQLPLPDRATDPTRWLAVRYSFCEPLCKRFVEVYGAERTESLLAAFGTVPTLTLRTNTLRISREELTERLRQRGIHAVPTAHSRTGIHVTDRIPPTALYGFAEGLFFIQDEASQLCTEALDAHAGMTVLDCCACPGSKSFGIAMDLENQGTVFSCDLHRNKLSLVESGAARLGISVLQTAARDAREAYGPWLETFDRVLCDVPCSGFGVISKKPELRCKDPNMCAELPEIQFAIVRQAAEYVKPNGRLVYSTCTLLPEENERVIERFLSVHREFTLKHRSTLFPDLDGTDGFFFAVMEKTSH